MANNKLKFMYFLPYENTIGADFWIYKGWENSCNEMGINFKILLSKDDFFEKVNTFNPDILFIQHKFGFRNNDLKKKIKYLNYFIKKKIKIFLAVDWFPEGPESTSYSDLEIFRNEEIATYFFGEREEDSMSDFVSTTGQDYIKIPNSADKFYHYPTKKYEKYSFDIVFLGAKLPKKKFFFEEILLPLKKKYKVGIYGPYWSISDNIKRIGANISRKIGLNRINEIINSSRISIPYEDENKLYSSSKICLNYHEKDTFKTISSSNHQNETYHKIMNQRSFKIPACGGFQLIDDIDYLRKYYKDDEMISCKDPKDWFDKIEEFINNHQLREKYARKACEKTHKEHLYENRINLILELANKL